MLVWYILYLTYPEMIKTYIDFLKKPTTHRQSSAKNLTSYDKRHQTISHD